MTSLLAALVAVGRTGIPEIIISGFIFHLAWTGHSLLLATLAALLLWPGLVNLFTLLQRGKGEPKDR